MPANDPVPAPSKPNDPERNSSRPALTSWRSAHRSRNHRDAHAEDELPPADDATDHPLIAGGPVPLVIEQAELDRLIETLRAAGSFAYDTEFIGELTYHPILCLIQVATTEQITLIDPMANLSLDGFWDLLADPTVEKLMHAGEQDVEPVARHFNYQRGAANVIDTQITAGFCGMAYPVALLKLVLELTGVKLGKGLTFTHWDQRPLSAVQLRYAADDVRYLPMIWNELRTRIESTGHRDWLEQACAEMCEPKSFGFNPQTYYSRVRGMGSLTNGGLKILRELTIWRNDAAREANVPARALLKDEVLVDLARSPVRNLEKLDRVRGLPRPVRERQGDAIIAATERAAAAPNLPGADRTQEPSPTDRFAADSLFAVAAAICAANSIDLALITSRNEIAEFYRLFSRKASSEELDALHINQSWRRSALGDPLLRFLKGEPPDAELNLKWNSKKLDRRKTETQSPEL